LSASQPAPKTNPLHNLYQIFHSTSYSPQKAKEKEAKLGFSKQKNNYSALNTLRANLSSDQ